MIGSANISAVSVSCVTNTYSIGGSITGLSGSGLVLQDNGGSDLTASSNGMFSFSTQVASGAAYSVSIKSQPASPSQTCSVGNGAGTTASANVTSISVTCVTNTYSVGGTVSGLLGSGLTLQDNGGNDLGVATSGTFSFSAPVADSMAYSVSVKSQPVSPSQTCSVSNGAGTIATAAVTSVGISCVTNSYSVGGAVSGLSGSGLVLEDNGGNDLTISSNGSFSFSAPVLSGATYSVSVKNQPTSPSQTCTVVSGGGMISSSNAASVSVSCVTNSYSIGGIVSGLLGSGLTLQDNSGNDLAVTTNGSFAFSAPVLSGMPYAVSVRTQPTSPAQKCIVAGANGLVGGANLATVNVVCTASPGRFAYVLTGVAPSTVSVFAVDALNGTLTAIDGSPFTSVTDGSDLAVSPAGTFLYVISDLTDPSQSSLAVFALDASSGAVQAQVGSSYTIPGAFQLAMDPAGKYLYVATSGVGGGSVYGFSIDASTGSLTSVAGSPFSGGYSRGLRVDPTGQYLYVSNSQLGSVLAYSIGPTTGTLTAISGSPFPASGQPTAIAIDPSGKFLYDVNNVFLSGAVTGVYSYTIGSGSGVLSAIAGSPFGSGFPIGIAVDGAGTVAYVGDDANTLTAYSIDSTSGALTKINGSTITTATTPRTVVVHPKGTFLYVGGWLDGGLREYLLTSTPGILSPVGAIGTLPQGSVIIAIPSND
jgi:6-phosphogluconolactonase (cycloisomerase 2 family)